MKAKIIKGIGGFYYVEPCGSAFLSSQEETPTLIECKARGVLRHQKMKPTVGDYVELSENEDGQWTIECIEPRRSILVRPPVANVDCALLCFAVKQPKPNLLLLDKLLANCLYFHIEPIICLTKTDLKNTEYAKIKTVYERAGFSVLGLSVKEPDELGRLLECIAGKTAFMAGPSGAGKSTLANRICENKMDTGALSEKLGRGKHTTRHVELLRTRAGSFLLDTPGFSSLELEPDIKSEDLKHLYPEFCGRKCRFSNCRHISEPGCAVREAVRCGEIDKERYKRYKTLYESLEEREKY